MSHQYNGIQNRNSVVNICLEEASVCDGCRCQRRISANKCVRVQWHLQLQCRADRMSGRRRPLIQGHRGSPYAAPENTVDSFLAAAAAGADCVELDAQLTADGHVVVFHDESGDVSAYTDGSMKIHEMTLAQIQSLAFKASALHCPADCVPGCRIPTLEEVLVTIRDKTSMQVTVELKSAHVELPALDVVKRTGMLARVNVSSFHHHRVIKAKQAEPSLSAALLFNADSAPTPPDFPAICLAAGAAQADIRYDLLTRSHVASAHAQGVRVMAWFRSVEAMINAGHADEEKWYPEFVDMGVDVICTNYPEKLAALLARADVDGTMASSS
jgi:glycerophosphoryl diester phosphodiesterase